MRIYKYENISYSIREGKFGGNYSLFSKISIILLLCIKVSKDMPNWWEIRDNKYLYISETGEAMLSFCFLLKFILIKKGE